MDSVSFDFLWPSYLDEFYMTHIQTWSKSHKDKHSELFLKCWTSMWSPENKQCFFLLFDLDTSFWVLHDSYSYFRNILKANIPSNFFMWSILSFFYSFDWVNYLFSWSQESLLTNQFPPSVFSFFLLSTCGHEIINKKYLWKDIRPLCIKCFFFLLKWKNITDAENV